MFWHILRFEVRYQLRRPATWLYFAVLFLLAFGFLSSDAVELGGGRGKTFKNAPYVLAQATMILTLVGQVITSALVGNSILRDYQTRTHELLFTTGISRAGYLGGRFGGATLAMLLVYLAIPLGAMAGSVMPWVDAAKMHPVHLANYLQPFLVFGVTNVLFVSALYFAAGALTRSQFVVYTLGIFLLVLTTVTGQLTKDLRNDWLAVLTDPFGLDPLRLATRYWTVADRNTRLVPLEGFVLWNRVTWALVAVALVGLTFWLFRFSAQPIALRLPWRRAALAGGGTTEGAAGAGDPPAERTPGGLDALLLPGLGARAAAAPGAAAAAGAEPARASAAGQLLAVTRLAFAGTVRQVTFLAIALIGVVNVFMNAWFAGRFGDQTVQPRTYLIAEAVNSFGLFFIVLLTMFVGEIVWRERQLGADQIQDALPVSPAVHLAGRALAVVGAMAVLNLVLIATGVLVQTIRGFHEYELGVYLKSAFLVEFPFVVQYALLAFLVHTVVNHKAVGHVVLVAFWVLLIAAGPLGLEHQLYNFGDFGRRTYSDMNGYGPFVPRVASLVAYWTLFALALGVLAYLAWVRGTDATAATRRAHARARFGGPARLALGATGLGAAAVGGFVFYNTNVLHTYAPKKVRQAFQAAYEKRYRARFAELAVPSLVAVDVEADLVPERRAYTVRGTHTYVNRTGRPLDTLALTIDAGAPGGEEDRTTRRTDVPAWSRPATRVLDDAEQGFQVWRLAAPLAPGDTLVMRYATRFAARGFPNGGLNDRVVANGMFVTNPAPQMGYQRGRELDDDDDRKKQGLAPRPLMAARDSVLAQRFPAFGREADYVSYRATVRTAPDQIAVTPGYLQSERVEGGRRVFRYAMDAPMANFYAFQSGRYAVRRAAWRGPYCPGAVRDGCAPRDTAVEIAVYYHPAHASNVDRMIRSVQRSLDYFSRAFGPYQYRQVRIIEFPRYAEFAQSFPNTIPYSEGLGFIFEPRDERGRDLPFQVTAHEVAHQWWGHQVLPADVQGETMIVESLAEYSSLMVSEREFGRAAMEPYLRAELDWYLRGRGTEAKRELPLALVEGQGYLRYGKGGLVLYALRDYLGEAAMNRALSAYVRKTAFSRGPYTTTRDLVAELRAVTPDSLQPLVTDLLEEITLWDLKAEGATAARRPDGRWAVRVDVAARKVRADTAGAERPVAMRDYVTVGMYAGPSTGKDWLGRELRLERRLVAGDRATLEFVVDRRPDRVVVDPYHLLIDRDYKDNMRDVLDGAAGAAPPTSPTPPARSAVRPRAGRPAG